MNAKLKTRWVKALRSGRYKQTQAEMKNEEGYCCLGVLRNILHPGSNRKAGDISGDFDEILCNEHAQEAGITTRQQNKLARMNDNFIEFPEIADYIEKRL